MLRKKLSGSHRDAAEIETHNAIQHVLVLVFFSGCTLCSMLLGRRPTLVLSPQLVAAARKDVSGASAEFSLRHLTSNSW